MLIQATKKDIETYGDFAYTLAMNQTRSCYPTYTDGIKTKEEFLANALKGVTKNEWELLLFLMDDKVEGWIQYYWIPEDKYLQLYFCNIHKGIEQALKELLQWLKERFFGYTLYFGFPESNTDAICFLIKNEFLCIEEAWNHVFFFEEYIPLAENDTITIVNRENFEDFRAVYHPTEKTYWNCDRILEKLDEWIIFLSYQEGVPIGTVFLQGKKEDCEIFGVAFANDKYKEDMFRLMLVTALNYCKRNGTKYMTFFCEEYMQNVVMELGFRYIGKYVLYSKTIE